jgi:hypothetical protein
LLKKSFITGITILQPLYLLYIYAILIPNWGNHHTANSEETELSYVVEHRQNNPMNLSGDQEELTSE